MACSVAALGATSPSTIEDAIAINKSYPDFFEDLKSLGALVQI
jgi:3-phosphoshikimate 1-carboxyvinyltransferase